MFNKIILRQVVHLTNHPRFLDGTYRVDCENLHLILGTISISGDRAIGPCNIEFSIRMGDNFLGSTPEVKIVSPIYHLNVDEKGKIFTDILYDWNLRGSLVLIFQRVESLILSADEEFPKPGSANRVFNQFPQLYSLLQMHFTARFADGLKQNESEEIVTKANLFLLLSDIVKPDEPITQELEIRSSFVIAEFCLSLADALRHVGKYLFRI